MPIAPDELPDDVCANAPVAAVAVKRPAVMAINSLLLLMFRLPMLVAKVVRSRARSHARGDVKDKEPGGRPAQRGIGR
ncbi:hypothetical protein NK8_22640 [Caballeronia sp. NK8]|nr:hypothetical protein NK8_22640 [Caballeronia sp. NK8]